MAGTDRESDRDLNRDPDLDPDLDPDNEENRYSIYDTIDSIPEKDLRRLLKELAEWNDGVCDIIFLRYRGEMDEESLRRILGEIDAVRTSYKMYSFTPEIKERCTDQLEEYLYRYVPEFIKAGKFDAANRVITAVYDTVISYNNYQTNNFSGVIDDCIMLWRDIESVCPVEYKTKLLDELEPKSRENTGNNHFNLKLGEFLDERFNEKESLLVKIKWLDKRIANIEYNIPSPMRQGTGLGDAVLKKLMLMQKAEFPSEEISAFIKKYWAVPELREDAINGYLKAGKLEYAVQVLIQSKKYDKDDDHRLLSDSERLIELYKKMGNDEKYKQEVKEYIFEIAPEHIGYYTYQWDDVMSHIRMLKEVCETEEWEKYREKLLHDDRFKFIQLDILEEEGLYEQLLNLILRKDAVYEMDAYEKKLKPLFPEQMKFFYSKHILQEAETASTRVDYEYIVEYLRKLCTYPGGRAMAENMASQWRVQFGRKRIFMNLLTEAGF